MDDSGRVGEQHDAYRKGMVLGLTLAEVGILIIFVLLLLLVFGELKRAALRRDYAGKVAITAADLAAMKASVDAIEEIAGVLGTGENTPPEDFRRLARVVRDAAGTPGAKSALAEANPALQEIREAHGAIARFVDSTRMGDTAAITGMIEQQAFRVANQEGQLRLLQDRLAVAGQGKGERPCWVRPDGTIDYLYDVVLTSRGIRMKEHTYPDRIRERSLLPAPTVNPEEVLSEAEFLRRTRALFLYSHSINCRFFVVIYDATATHEKPLYKSLLRTVEGHFYKRLDNGAAPF